MGEFWQPNVSHEPRRSMKPRNILLILLEHNAHRRKTYCHSFVLVDHIPPDIAVEGTATHGRFFGKDLVLSVSFEGLAGTEICLSLVIVISRRAFMTGYPMIPLIWYLIGSI